MSSPIDQRIRSVESAPDGYISPSGVARFKSTLNGHVSEYADWRRHPFTKSVVSALQDMVIHHPTELSDQDRLVQFGMNQGLSFALQLIVDPSSVWPGVFGGTTQKEPPTDLPPMDFNTSLDQVFDV